MESLHEMENEEDGYVQKYRALSFLTQKCVCMGFTVQRKRGKREERESGEQGTEEGKSVFVERFEFESWGVSEVCCCFLWRGEGAEKGNLNVLLREWGRV